MRKLFQSLEGQGVEYLLISGQATVLYGAATFSEDVDIWIRPTPRNARRLLDALTSVGARVHRLTPPLTPRNMKVGHGFHFVIPGRPAGVFLDIMGHPPRVGTFEAARKRARIMATPWGRIPVAGIRDLVKLKRTRRLQDYEVISNLVRIEVQSAREPSPALLRWAASATYRPEDRRSWKSRLGIRVSESACRREVLEDLNRDQKRDVCYWRSRIADLRRLRAAGRLLPDGLLVQELPGLRR